jgi:hypothetical protein
MRIRMTEQDKLYQKLLKSFEETAQWRARLHFRYRL